MRLIPRLLHQIWVGDAPAPTATLETWPAQHPDWSYRLWTMRDFHDHPWRGKAQMDAFASRGCWEGVADIMRYEILFQHGGIYLDADLECLRPLDDWLLDCAFFAVYESEQHRPGYVANGILGTSLMNAVLWRILDRICALAPAQLAQPETWAFETVGPTLLTEMLREYRGATILPSVLFLPQHYEDATERQSSLIYARHAWTGTKQYLARREAVPA